jgi:hypothetical protein
MLEVRPIAFIHHLSNAYRGISNPGIDSQILKLTYSCGR